MPPAKAWKLTDPKSPKFPGDFEIVTKAVLQLTDIGNNNNKYYAVEVHAAEGKIQVYRVFTHYGRTDDLDTDPNSGQKECRYFGTLAEAQASYQSIYRQKTSPSKGYKELSLASSRIGSDKARGSSSGRIDDQTLKKAAEASKKAAEETKLSADSAPVPPGGAVVDGTGDSAAVVQNPEVVATTPTEPAAEVGLATEPVAVDASLDAAPNAASLSEAEAECASTSPPNGSLFRRLVGRIFGPAPATSVPGQHGKPKKKGRSTTAAWIPEIPTGLPAEAGDLHPRIAELVDYVYSEATSALTTSVAARITAQGIETPLGILTLGQIQKGEDILQELYAAFSAKRKRPEDLVRLSGEFYTVIPHRIGRTRAAAQAAVIDSLESFEQKQETLQLMKDMLQVNGEGNVLFHSQSHAQYQALRCGIGWLDHGSDEFCALRDFVVDSQIKSRKIKVTNVFSLRRESEWKAFADDIGNHRQLFHGSRIKNWVGILSRGILMPKIAVSLGVNRTDAGWLGNGIYFGDAACTSTFYTSPGTRGTRLMAVARVALGRMKEYQKITYGLAAPPPGFDSCHGVRAQKGTSSQFADDEYVIYQPNQQRLEYLVELRA